MEMDLFEREAKVLEDAQTFLDTHDDSEYNLAFTSITKGYEKLLKQLRRTTKISDRATGDLNTEKLYLLEKEKRMLEEKSRISAELNVATHMQSSILPTIFPQHDKFEVFATMLPAKEVGGDFYDFFFIDNTHCGIVIADVSGKGVPAAMFMMIARTLIKEYAQLGLSPSEIFCRANERLCENNGANLFVTAFMGIIDLETGKMTTVNAAHNFPLLKRKNGEFEWFEQDSSLFLAGMELTDYEEYNTTLEEGDIIYLYTDGVTEATNANDELFSDELLLDISNRLSTEKLEEFLTCIKIEIDNFVKEAPQFDDITMLAFRYNGKPLREITLEAKRENVTKVVDFINELLTDMKCDDEIKTQFAIAIDEVFVNVASYAYEHSDGNATIKCYIIEDPLEIKIEFMDEGKEFNPLESENPDFDLELEDMQIGGLGIFMVKEMMDKVTYERIDNKNIFTISKNIGG